MESLDDVRLEAQLEAQLKETNLKLSRLRLTHGGRPAPKKASPVVAQSVQILKQTAQPQNILQKPQLFDANAIFRALQEAEQLSAIQPQYQMLIQAVQSVRQFKAASDASVVLGNQQLDNMQTEHQQEEPKRAAALSALKTPQLLQKSEALTRALSLLAETAQHAAEAQEQNQGAVQQLQQENEQLEVYLKHLLVLKKNAHLEARQKARQVELAKARAGGELHVLAKQISDLEIARKKLDADLLQVQQKLLDQAAE